MCRHTQFILTFVFTFSGVLQRVCLRLSKVKNNLGCIHINKHGVDRERGWRCKGLELWCGGEIKKALPLWKFNWFVRKSERFDKYTVKIFKKGHCGYALYKLKILLKRVKVGKPWLWKILKCLFLVEERAWECKIIRLKKTRVQ